MSSIPTQTRAVDPFASYDSNTVNKLTRSISRGQNGFLTLADFFVEIPDSTGNDLITVYPGTAITNDVLIQVTEQHTVNFRDSSHYVVSSGGIFDETGYYYIVLSYQYVKSRPAPQASIKILRPSEVSHPDLGNTLIFICAVLVVAGMSVNEISAVYNFDPTDTTVRRRFVHLDVAADYSVPTHDSTRDVGRVLYEYGRNKFWFGFDDRWEEISAGVSISIDTDSTGVLAGILAYVDSNGKAQPALGNSLSTRAEMVVLEVGTSDSGNGRARLTGKIDSVLVETGVIVGVGSVLYCSNTEPGKVTNSRPEGSNQVVGRALTAGNDVIPISMLFFPGDIIFSAVAGTIEAGDWDSTSAPYYYDVDISILNIQTNSLLINCWSAGYKISPFDVQIRDAGDTCRIYMPVQIEVDYTISDGAGGGTAGGTVSSTSHALLSNLSYATSGHTGFAPSPHGNADHSLVFITASNVTYENLNTNGDVGTGATQVAQGNHTHSIYQDVPSGETILFEKDSAVVGYVLVTTLNDAVIYVTSGSVAGGEAGGTQKIGGTWTQPSHTLSISEMPAHTHQQVGGGSVTGGNDFYRNGGGALQAFRETTSTGGGLSHNHGTSWRPVGMNFTRQQRL